MAEPLDHTPDESQLQAPKALRGDLAALFGAEASVPPAVDAAVLASARRHLAPRGRARTAIRWAGVAAAAAAAILLVVIHLGPAREAPARVAAKPAAAKAVTPDRSDINGDGRVDILDAFLLAKRLDTRRALDAAWDITGDGLVDRRDVDALAAAVVRLRPPPPRDKGAFLSPGGAHKKVGLLSPDGAYYDSPGQRPGNHGTPPVQPCKGVLPRNGGGAHAAAGPSTPLQGCIVLGPRLPRALPWAIIARSFGASEMVTESQRSRPNLARLDGGTVQ